MSVAVFQYFFMNIFLKLHFLSVILKLKWSQMAKPVAAYLKFLCIIWKELPIRGKKSPRVKYFVGYYLNSSFPFSPLRIMPGGDIPLSTSGRKSHSLLYFTSTPTFTILGGCWIIVFKSCYFFCLLAKCVFISFPNSKFSYSSAIQITFRITYAFSAHCICRHTDEQIWLYLKISPSLALPWIALSFWHLTKYHEPLSILTVEFPSSCPSILVPIAIISSLLP